MDSIFFMLMKLKTKIKKKRKLKLNSNITTFGFDHSYNQLQFHYKPEQYDIVQQNNICKELQQLLQPK